MDVYMSIQDMIGHTPIIKLNHLNVKESVGLYAKLELANPAGSVKDRVGVYMVKDAEEKVLMCEEAVAEHEGVMADPATYADPAGAEAASRKRNLFDDDLQYRTAQAVYQSVQFHRSHPVLRVFHLRTPTRDKRRPRGQIPVPEGTRKVFLP